MDTIPEQVHHLDRILSAKQTVKSCANHGTPWCLPGLGRVLTPPRHDKFFQLMEHTPWLPLEILWRCRQGILQSGAPWLESWDFTLSSQDFVPAWIRWGEPEQFPIDEELFCKLPSWCFDCRESASHFLFSSLSSFFATFVYVSPLFTQLDCNDDHSPWLQGPCCRRKGTVGVASGRCALKSDYYTFCRHFDTLRREHFEVIFFRVCPGPVTKDCDKRPLAGRASNVVPWIFAYQVSRK